MSSISPIGGIHSLDSNMPTPFSDTPLLSDQWALMDHHTLKSSNDSPCVHSRFDVDIRAQLWRWTISPLLLRSLRPSVAGYSNAAQSLVLPSQERSRRENPPELPRTMGTRGRAHLAGHEKGHTRTMFHPGTHGMPCCCLAGSTQVQTDCRQLK